MRNSSSEIGGTNDHDLPEKAVTKFRKTPSLLSKKSMKETEIEKKLVRKVKEKGGIAPKFVSPGYAGMPDRLMLLPGGAFAFAELKAPGMKPRPLQAARHRLLRSLGFKVYVIDGTEQIEEVLNGL